MEGSASAALAVATTLVRRLFPLIFFHVHVALSWSVRSDHRVDKAVLVFLFFVLIFFLCQRLCLVQRHDSQNCHRTAAALRRACQRMVPSCRMTRSTDVMRVPREPPRSDAAIK